MPPTKQQLFFLEGDIPAKECLNCQMVKPLTDFYRNKNNFMGVLPNCKKCTTKINYENEKPETRFKRGRSKVLQKFKLTLEEYEQMLKDQNYGCAICGETDTDLSLHIDHDHNTNKIRGLLCKKCNSGIGMFKERLDLIEKCIEYLKKYR